MPVITATDLPDNVAGMLDRKILQSMLDAANARAVRLAPCLAGVTLEAGTVGTGGAFAAGVYRWVVTACGAWGESVTSNEVQANLAANATQELVWTPKQSAASYRIYRASGPVGAYGVLALAATVTADTYSWVDTGAVLTIGSPPPLERIAEARLTLIGAISRWQKAWACKQPQANSDQPMTQPGFLLWPSEIKQLSELCGKGDQKAFVIDTAPTGCSTHQPWCSLAFGATYCSCGADLTLAAPLWEY